MWHTTLPSLPSLPMPDWPIPCDVCGQRRRLAELTVTHRPLPGLEHRFAAARRNVAHCPDRWWCVAYARMPGPWQGRPQLAVSGSDR